jgi:hypothetical protein
MRSTTDIARERAPPALAKPRKEQGKMGWKH